MQTYTCSYAPKKLVSESDPLFPEGLILRLKLHACVVHSMINDFHASCHATGHNNDNGIFRKLSQNSNIPTWGCVGFG